MTNDRLAELVSQLSRAVAGWETAEAEVVTLTERVSQLEKLNSVYLKTLNEISKCGQGPCGYCNEQIDLALSVKETRQDEKGGADKPPSGPGDSLNGYVCPAPTTTAQVSDMCGHCGARNGHYPGCAKEATQDLQPDCHITEYDPECGCNTCYARTELLRKKLTSNAHRKDDK
jgi:hypothetical protein